MRRILTGLLWALGTFLVLRAIAEPFTIGDDYADDWGGPTRADVLAVHMMPGIIAAALMAYVLMRRRKRRPEREASETPNLS